MKLNITPLLAEELLQTIANDKRIVFSPISPRRFPGKRRPNEVIKQHESTIDYEFECTQDKKYWNDADTNRVEPGDMFAFLHQAAVAGKFVEYYRVVEINPPTFGETARPHWHEIEREYRHANRNVLVLGEKLGESTFDELKHCIGYSQNFKIARKTMRAWNWGADIALELKALIAPVPKNELATIWQAEASANILASTKEVANKALAHGYRIYDNSVMAAARTIEMVLAPAAGNYGISVADLQSGKTGMAIAIAGCFNQVLRQRTGQDDKLGVLVITHISDRQIVEQTSQNFERAGWKKSLFSSNSTALLWKNASSPKTFVHFDMLSAGAFRETEGRLTIAVQNFLEAGCNKLLVISDEVQVASGLGQQFSRWLNTMNFDINGQNANLYMIGITATAAGFYHPRSDGNSLHVAYNPPGEVYYGLRNMLQAGRIVDTGSLALSSKADLESALNSRGILQERGKYILARVMAGGKFGSDSQVESWEWLAEKHGMKVHYVDSKNNNISILDHLLSFELESGAPLALIIIKASLRAGITLDTVANLAAVFDAYSGNDAVVQSLPGRMCGNQADRREATFPIFTKLEVIQQYIAEMDDLANGILPTPKSITPIAGVFTRDGEIKIGTLEQYRAERISQGLQIATNTIYGHVAKNYADMLLSNEWPDHTERAISLGYRPLDFPYERSVVQLLQKYEQLQDSDYVLWVNPKLDDRRPTPTKVHNALQ